MSPRTITCLTLVGVLLAGAPLLHLTGKRAVAAGQEAVQSAAEAPAGRPVGLCIRYTGRPVSIQAGCAGAVLVDEAGDEGGVWEGEVALPDSARWELEVTVRWPEPAADEASGAQAVSVSLIPAGQAEMTETQWTFPGEAELHSVYTFTPAQP